MKNDGAIIENFYGVYLLYCINPKFKGRTYIGFTVDPNRRIKQHNTGVRAGGAYRTSNKGPWEMALIIHGFPNDISALRFEWAWQNPKKSRRLKNLPMKKNKEIKFDYCLRILANMLLIEPWSRLPLTLRWLKQEYCKDFPPGLEPPIHMPVAFGPVQSLKVQSEAEKNVDDSENNQNYCCLCKLEVSMNSLMRCLSPTCLMNAHIICLATHMLQGDQSSFLPVEGSCPKCNLTLLWGDLVRLKNGCYQNENVNNSEEGNVHWTDSLSQKPTNE